MAEAGMSYERKTLTWSGEEPAEDGVVVSFTSGLMPGSIRVAPPGSYFKITPEGTELWAPE